MKYPRTTLLVAALLSCTACGGEDGASGMDGEKGESGDTGKTGTNGTSCSIATDGDTKTLKCTDGTSTVINTGEQGGQGDKGDTGSAGSSCQVKDNGDGTKTVSCTDGTNAVISNGSDGKSCSVKDLGGGTKTVDCTDGSSVQVTDGANVKIANFHGTNYLQTHDEYANGAKTKVNATVTGVSADESGKLTVNFSVVDPSKDDAPVTNLESVSANVAQLLPSTGMIPFNRWVPYIINTVTAGGAMCGESGAKEWNCAPWNTDPSASAFQGGSESSGTGANNGTLDNHNDGTYTYTFKTTLGSVTDPLDGSSTIGYDRGHTHRVVVMLGGHSGPTATATYDFVPNGGEVTDERQVIDTGACRTCHGTEFKAHGGNRLTIESCTTCHTPGTKDPQSGESLDLKVMIHKIHAGTELTAAAGADTVLWDDPTTVGDETADNGNVIWGYRDSKHDFWKIEFPAVIANCTKCHDGTAPKSDNWKKVPSRAACGSCHDNVNFVSGANHPAGAQANDLVCSSCHQEATNGIGPSIAEAHDFTKSDIRNIPEFIAEISLTNLPSKGYYEAGDPAPQLKIQLKDNEAGGNPVIDPSVMTSEPSNGQEGCVPDNMNHCPIARDGVFSGAKLYVHGPRARRMPAMVWGARAQLISALSEPYDLSAGGLSLSLTVDGGGEIIAKQGTGDVIRSGILNGVSLARTNAAPCNWADTGSAAVSAAEIATCLNGNTAFAARAVAFDSSGKIAIRSRNLGSVHSLQLQAGAATTALFGNGATVTNVQLAPGGADLRSDKGDPNITRDSTAIYYQLDPVDDLTAGTYIASLEISDRGRKSDSDYKTPTIAKFGFQVKQDKEELATAGNCNLCHQNKDGIGQIFDPARHHKVFDATSIDQCGACHDYEPGGVVGSSWGSGARAIAKRVHGIHNAKNLHYPVVTIDHADDPVNRFWDIEYPQDVRTCDQTCHVDGTGPNDSITTNGAWFMRADRFACMGCHDSDAASAHMKSNVYDPTPADMWSGDEQEACRNCH